MYVIKISAASLLFAHRNRPIRKYIAMLPCLQPMTYPLPSMFIPEKVTFSTAFPLLSSSHVLPKLSYPYTSLQASPCVIEKAAMNICP